ncbi:CoA transferase subunit A [Thauera linaloolentis]|uniref:Glutaconate CoA transferase subunit A n=1 Tax=Thauera linaloolentis (strain DSM 12138 / JCM 21573 / CCUG 41526 / CIP 105981 / IAM 15112 / NBRC 102519 / 47Lol) TaxID=1123367 RepID=N6XVZ9_THAL4|nr:CoA transferase [Thauera linaloolentis]ENO85931.1 glutaconate CoA transferase subunit A [Thauera linaloolentis 47Lol = DSM 12138]MCM8567489.1 CoA transferase subunit A [Thauera linaloolentis]
MSRNKLISLAEAVERHSWDGMQYASGASLPVGSDTIVFGRELVRRQRRDLHALFHCNTQQLNLLAAAGAVSKAECGFSGLEVFGFANGLRRAVETGQLALEDYSNLSFGLRLLAGALNWPFAPSTVNIGSDIQWRSAFAPDETPARHKIPTVTDPFSGREVGALSPLKPDVAAIHVSLADPLGNAIMLGTEWSRFELSRAAKKVVLIADAIVDTACMRQFPNLVRIPDIIVEAVVYWPFAAWPQSSPGFYDVDEAHMKAMNKALATPEGTEAYIGRYVDGYTDLDGYLDMIGRDTIEQLSRTGTAFLLDPFRQWIKTPEEVRALASGDAR